MQANALFQVTMPLLVVVRGEPQPQGNKSAFVIKPKDGGKPRAVVTEGRRPASREAFKTWRALVTGEAYDAMRGRAPFAGAVGFRATFTVRRPGGHFGTGRNAGTVRPSAPRYPTGRPDWDKLARAIGDALTDAGVYRDDSQIVEGHVSLRYPVQSWGGGLSPLEMLPDPTVLCGTPDADVLDLPGVVVRVWELG
jgi:Holliday junction resolvase RusA-like endonuclease